MGDPSSVETEINRLFLADDESFDLELVRVAVPYAEQKRIRGQVQKEMADEGKSVDLRPGVANLWGGEYGRRLQERLRDQARVRMALLVKQSHEQLHAVVCQNLKYCEKRTQNRLQLAAGIADGLLQFAGAWPVPTATVTVYLIRERLLDAICGCET